MKFTKIAALALVGCFSVILAGCNPPPPQTLGTIQGTVLDASSHPIAGATVTTDPVTSPAVSGSDGSYRISNVSPGVYTVQASAQGYEFDAVSVTVESGRVASAAVNAKSSIVPDGKGSISGRIMNDAANLPVAGASVSTIPATGSAYSSGDGSYTIPNVPAGNYRVVCSTPDYRVDTVSVSVTSGQVATPHHAAHRLEHEGNDTFMQANALPVPDAVDGTIGAGGDSQDWYRVVAQGNGRLTVKIQNLSRPGSASANVGKVSVLREDQQEIVNNGGATGVNSTETLLSVPVTAGQAYYVLVNSYSSHTSNYRVSVVFTAENSSDFGELNDSRAAATAIEANSSTVALIGYGSDAEDWYEITPQNSGNMVVTVYNLHPSNVAHGNCGMLELLNSSQSRLVTNGGATGLASHESLKAVPVVAGQHYYLHMSRYGNLDAAPYRLEVTTN